jgi:hypothetical protein
MLKSISSNMRMSSSSRKGLSQILYLIIAASVLMMVAMVITFTATDIIGGAGSQATDTSCGQALQGKCTSLGGNPASTYVSVPSTCIREGQFVSPVSGIGNVYDDAQATSSCSCPSTASSCSGSTCDSSVYVACSTV